MRSFEMKSGQLYIRTFVDRTSVHSESCTLDPGRTIDYYLIKLWQNLGLGRWNWASLVVGLLKFLNMTAYNWNEFHWGVQMSRCTKVRVYNCPCTLEIHEICRSCTSKMRQEFPICNSTLQNVPYFSTYKLIHFYKCAYFIYFL